MKLIVGLGNPGVRYRWTRHNVGFLVVDRFALSKGIPISTRRFRAIYGKGSLDGQEIVLLKPLTYMNLSGEAVKKAAHAFRIPLENIIGRAEVIYWPPEDWALLNIPSAVAAPQQ